MTSSTSTDRSARDWPVVSLLVGLFVAALFALPALAGLAETFEWRRTAVLSGEWWRVLTGHLSHTSVPNLLWNLGTFLVLGAVCELQDRRRFLLATLLAGLAVSFAVLLFAPETTVYRGLSGIDSALFGLLLVQMVRRARNQRQPALAALLLATGGLFLGKLAYEVLAGQALFAVDASGFVPVPLAHLAGALAGILVAWLPHHMASARMRMPAT